MSIYIKTEMKKMPESCFFCATQVWTGCVLCKKHINKTGEYPKTRPSWCPLVEIPERSRETPHNP